MTMSSVDDQVVLVVRRIATCFALESHFMDLSSNGPLSRTPKAGGI